MTQHRENIEAAVKEMIAAGYIEEVEVDGEIVWKLTESGRDYMARLQEHKA